MNYSPMCIADYYPWTVLITPQHTCEAVPVVVVVVVVFVVVVAAAVVVVVPNQRRL